MLSSVSRNRIKTWPDINECVCRDADFIGKMISEKTISEKTIGEIVAADYAHATILMRYDIDACCGGRRTLEEACIERGVDVDEVERKLIQLDEQHADADVRPEQWPLSFLTEYIEHVHHAFVREQLPVLLRFAEKVADVHGHQDPHLFDIDALIRELASTVNHHMVNEEELLFPQIRQSERSASRRPDQTDLLLSVIADYADEHERLGEVVRRLRVLTDDYQAPEHACNTYRAFYTGVHLFEQDLRRHLHLENNILFPRARRIASRKRRPARLQPATL